jgi:hypothetical protein
MEKKETIQDELREVAPSLLHQQQSTFQVPTGYFEQLPHKLIAAVNKEENNSSTIFFRSPRWTVFAAAAVTISILFFSLYYFRNPLNEETGAVDQWAKQEISKLPEEHVSAYIDNTNAFLQTATAEKTESNDLAVLIQDIPHEEIKRLLNDLPATEMP